MKKYVIAFTLLLIIATVGYMLLSGESRKPTLENTSQSSMRNLPTVEQPDNGEFPSEEGPSLYIGNPDAPVIISEFVDYNCPNCNTFHRTTKQQLESEYGDSIAFKIHQTPFIGPDSGRAARGAYCSEIHGAVFPEYHDGVFDFMYENFFESSNFQAEFDDVMTREVLTTIYTDAGGFKAEEFSTCIEDMETINKYINSDQLLAADAGVRGTPSFVIGDTSLVGPQQYSVFKALIEAEL